MSESEISDQESIADGVKDKLGKKDVSEVELSSEEFVYFLGQIIKNTPIGHGQLLYKKPASVEGGIKSHEGRVQYRVYDSWPLIQSDVNIEALFHNGGEGDSLNIALKNFSLIAQEKNAENVYRVWGIEPDARSYFADPRRLFQRAINEFWRKSDEPVSMTRAFFTEKDTLRMVFRQESK